MTRERYLPFGQPDFSDEEIAAVSSALRRGWIGMGPETIAFEGELSDALAGSEVVTVSSCTAALFLSLLVSGVGPGDEVVCPSLTWCSTANAALYLGARPVFCDIDPRTLNVTPATVTAALTPRTKAVTVVHFGGLAVDVAALRRALPASVSIVEDAAHAFGASYPDGSPVGSSGHLTAFSFYANKNLSTGEGGAVALGDRAIADRLRSLRQHGLPLDAWQRFTHRHSLVRSSDLTELGYKMNYTDLHASIGRVQLRRQPAFARRREAIVRYYLDAVAEFAPDVRFQSAVHQSAHARHLAVVLLPTDHMSASRDEVVAQLRAMNIGASIHYAPLHRMPLYGGDGPAPALPVTDRIAGQIMSLPLSASMTLDDARDVVGTLRTILTTTAVSGSAP